MVPVQKQLPSWVISGSKTIAIIGTEGGDAAARAACRNTVGRQMAPYGKPGKLLWIERGVRYDGGDRYVYEKILT